MSSQDSPNNNHRADYWDDEFDTLDEFLALVIPDEDEDTPLREEERDWAARTAGTFRAECRRQRMEIKHGLKISPPPPVLRELCRMDRAAMLSWIDQLEAGAPSTVERLQIAFAQTGDEDLRLLVLQLDHQRSVAR